MKPCGHQGCINIIKDEYALCFEHFRTGRQTDPVIRENIAAAPKIKQWHEDAIVDQLMKLNSNLKRIADALVQNPPSLDSSKGQPLSGTFDPENADFRGQNPPSARSSKGDGFLGELDDDPRD